MLIKNKKNNTVRECFAKIELRALRGKNRFTEIYLVRGYGALDIQGLRDFHEILKVTKFKEVDLTNVRGYEWQTNVEYELFDNTNEGCLSLLSKEHLF